MHYTVKRIATVYLSKNISEHVGGRGRERDQKIDKKHL